MVILREPIVKRGFLAFLSTEMGRKVSMFGTGTAMLGMFLGNFVPHTFGLSYYKDFVQCYEMGIPRPVPEKVLKRLEHAMDKLTLTPFERKYIKPFTVFGFDLFSAGSTKYRFGSLLGIPANYGYETAADIQYSEIVFRNQNIDRNSEAGKLLQEAIVLKEDEQVFGLCKTILQCKTHQLVLNSIFPSVSFLTVYSIGHYLNKRLDLFVRPLGLRLVMYSILGFFGFGSWCFLKDFTQVSYDADVDKELSSLGPEFVEAGVRYYDKILKKNMALRSLMKDDTYTAKGNLNYLIRQKSMPLTARKAFFENKWKELHENTDNAQQFAL